MLKELSLEQNLEGSDLTERGKREQGWVMTADYQFGNNFTHQVNMKKRQTMMVIKHVVYSS